jgi:hypothetical protein
MSKRTQYVKLSLTDAEYDALEKFSDNFDKPIAYCIRMMIERLADVSSVYSTLRDGFNNMPIEEKEKLSNQFFESELSPQNKADIYKFLSDMKHISQFSLDWQKASKKQIF